MVFEHVSVGHVMCLRSRHSVAREKLQNLHSSTLAAHCLPPKDTQKTSVFSKWVSHSFDNYKVARVCIYKYIYINVYTLHTYKCTYYIYVYIYNVCVWLELYLFMYLCYIILLQIVLHICTHGPRTWSLVAEKGSPRARSLSLTLDMARNWP